MKNANDAKPHRDDDQANADLRTKICIWVILIGMGNFLAYTIGYTILGGEAVRGKVCYVEENDEHYYYLDSGAKVNHDQFIYSGIHSISIWLTVAAIMMAMLTLAKDRIVDSMHEAVVRGRTLCTVLAVLIGFCTAGLMFQFVRDFLEHVKNPEVVARYIDLPHMKEQKEALELKSSLKQEARNSETPSETPSEPPTPEPASRPATEGE